jgi:hypothetical protein
MERFVLNPAGYCNTKEARNGGHYQQFISGVRLWDNH